MRSVAFRCSRVGGGRDTRRREDALTEPRQDEYHWWRAISPIQATDPEILLTIRAVLASPTGWARRHLPVDLPMVSAAVEVVDAVNAVTR